MSDPVSWPYSVLPDPSNAFSMDVPDTSVRTKMDSGHVRQRRRWTKENGKFAVEWELDDEEYQVFRAWWAEKIGLGTDWFTLNLPVGGGMAVQTARFVSGQFKADYVPVGNWKVSCVLEVDAPTRLAEGMVDLLLDAAFLGLFDDFELSIDDLYTLTHTTFPSQFP